MAPPTLNSEHELGASVRVLWPHNFNPDIPNSGVFMHTAAAALADLGVDCELLYLGDLRSPRKIVDAIGLLRDRAVGFDLVHSQYGSACALATAYAPRGIPRVVSLRGSDWTPAFATSVKMRLHARAASTMTRLALPRFDLGVVVSNRIAAEVRASIHGAPELMVLPSPIDLDLFQPTDKRAARESIGLSEPDASYVLFTSLHRDAPHKRRELAEAGVAVAQRTIPNLRILEATGIDHAKMPAVVNAADVIICTSVAEGWPNSIKEALACNVPFVATDVSDLAEIAARDNVCRVVDANPHAIGEGLVDVLRQPGQLRLREHVSHMARLESSQRLVAGYQALLNR